MAQTFTSVGREIRARDERGLLIQRIYVVGKRVYFVSAYVPSRLECGVEDVIKTLNTFELIEEKA